MKTRKVAELFTVGMMMFAVPAFAQEHVGNGGGEDVEFHKITSEIQSWMKANLDLGKLDEKLQLNGVSGLKLNADLSEAVNSTTLKFQDEPVMVAGQSRVCGNDRNPNRIVCNRKLWNHQIAGNTKYAIVLHEYLGVAGYERNVMEYSQYPISKNILDYVYEKKVFELGMEKTTSLYRDVIFRNLSFENYYGYVQGKIIAENKTHFVVEYADGTIRFPVGKIKQKKIRKEKVAIRVNCWKSICENDVVSNGKKIIKVGLIYADGSIVSNTYGYRRYDANKVIKL